ncbi:MAG: M48 family metalloprotease [Planctomycetota bacterium JB042]
MDFPTHQERARSATGRMVVLFALAVALVAIAVYGLSLLLIAAWKEGFAGVGWWNPGLFMAVVAGVGLTVGGPTVLELRRLRRGAAALARRLGGREVTARGDGSPEARLVNVVEEAAIAAGLPIPRAFVLEDEPAVNAFAVGLGPDDAVVGVTRGALDSLDRAELGAVVAHELAHVTNGDSAIDLRLLGATSGLESMTAAGRWLLDVSTGTALLTWVAGGGLLLIGKLGSGAAALLRASVSREREFLADAHAVELTRDAAALASALRKVRADPRGGRLRTHRSAMVSHLFLHRTVGRRWGRLATHPALRERIRRLEGGRKERNERKERKERALPRSG